MEGAAIDTLIRLFETYATKLPLELFVLVGAFIEEAISPIPSFVVLIPAGAIAQLQGYAWWYLIVLSIIAACGRIVAAVLLYILADKGEGWLFGKGRRFFGISHQQLERYGQRLSGSAKDWVALFLLNALPALPTAMLSLVCGFIKVEFRLFVTTTFFGAIIYSFIHLSIGYAGLRALDAFRQLESASRIVTLIIAAALLVWFIYYRRKKRSAKKSHKKSRK